jgi:hypothetical protein
VANRRIRAATLAADAIDDDLAGAWQVSDARDHLAPRYVSMCGSYLAAAHTGEQLAMPMQAHDF